MGKLHFSKSKQQAPRSIESFESEIRSHRRLRGRGKQERICNKLTGSIPNSSIYTPVMATIMEAFDPSIVAVAAAESSSKKTRRSPAIPMFARGDSLEDMGTTSVVPRPLSFHPLQNSWTMWLFTHDRSKPWEENQHSIYTFNSVEEFWGLYHNIALPSELPSGCDYSLFKDGIIPMWEDEKNKAGGRWVLQSGKKNMIGSPGNEQPALDLYWLEVLMCLIGEGWGSPEHGREVNGAVISMRGERNSKLGVWLANCENVEAVVNIGLNIKSRLGLGSRANIQFDAHQDTKVKTGSTVKHMYKI